MFSVAFSTNKEISTGKIVHLDPQLPGEGEFWGVGWGGIAGRLWEGYRIIKKIFFLYVMREPE